MPPRRLLPVILSLLCFIFISHSPAQFTQQGPRLVGSGAFGGSYMGMSVALSADGNTAIAGGILDSSGGGAAWIFTRTNGVWAQQGTKLVGTGHVGLAWQGNAVAISADGNTVIIGGPQDNGNIGAAWIFTRSNGSWTQQGAKLVGTGYSGTSSQGFAVALSADGNTALIGGGGDNGSIGATWVFTRDNGTWTQQGGKLVGSGAIGTSWQGSSVSLSADGNTALIGGLNDNSGDGAVWIFKRYLGGWGQQGAKLVGTGADGLGGQGSSVSISGDGNTALVGGYWDGGNAGAAWIFTQSGGVWSQQGPKIVPSDHVPGSSVGGSVSLSYDGNTAILGGNNSPMSNYTAWIFTRNSGTWTQQGLMFHPTESDVASNTPGGVALAADGNTAIVGGPGIYTIYGSIWIYSLPSQPALTTVADVPHDQGGQVRLSWSGSPFDNALSRPLVTSYSIWRKPATTFSASTVKPMTHSEVMSDTSVDGYDFVASVPALQSASYQTVVPTLEDSSASGTAYEHFLVVAQTTDPTVHYASAVDSGYSVDNLAPIPPAGLQAIVQAGPQVELSWNAPTDPDVRSYTIYRSATSGFTPAFGNLIGTSTSTGYVDATAPAGAMAYYRIVAVDVHDNASAPSQELAAPVAVSQQFSVGDKWNMVSVPLSVGDFSKSALFPTATTNAFAYDLGYAAYGVLENGRGYWIKFNGGQSVELSGLARPRDTVDVAEGWNMVGTLSSPLTASTIASIPGGIVTGNFFGYNNGYQSSTVLSPGKGYWVKVSQAGRLIMDASLSSAPANRIRIQDSGELPPPPPDGAISSNAVPMEYALSQNYPNPFNPSTRIEYALPTAGFVDVKVYNMLGQEVATLVNEYQDAGYRSVSFDASGLPSGMYTYKIAAGSFSQVKKMVLIK